MVFTMKNISKITLIILFILSSSLLAQWEVNINSDIIYFVNMDIENKSIFTVDVNTSITDDFLAVYDNYQISTILVFSDKITKDTNLYFRIKKKSNNYINYSINNDEDIVEDNNNDICIAIGAKSDNGIRGNNLIKILLDSLNIELYNRYTDELLCSFNLDGLQEILEENLGNTEWYNQKIKNWINILKQDKKEYAY